MAGRSGSGYETSTVGLRLFVCKRLPLNTLETRIGLTGYNVRRASLGKDAISK